MAYERRDSSGIAVSTTLSIGCNNSATSLTIADATGWPTGGANGDFFMRIETEIIRISSRTGTTLTVSGGVSGRGQDGTAAVAHVSGVSAEFVFTRTDLNEANFAVAKTVGAVTTQGDMLVADAANSLARLAKGTTGLPLVAGASIPGYAQLGTTGIADSAITLAKLAAAVQATLVPPGVMVAYGGTSEPTGWLFANAQTVSRTTYAALFAIYGTTYNTGGEAGTDFRMPDLRGRVLVGLDNLGGATDAGRLSVANTLGSSGGTQTVTLDATTMPSHTHTQDTHTHIQTTHTHTQTPHNHGVTDPTHQHTAVVNNVWADPSGSSFATPGGSLYGLSVTVNQMTNFVGTGISIQNTTPAVSSDIALNQNTVAINQSTGGGAAHDNMPPYQLCNVIVKT